MNSERRHIIKEIKKLGLGTMGMSFQNREQSIKTIHTALEEGVTIFNTGDFYCKGESQVVLGEALKGIPRESYFVSLKFGVSFTEDTTLTNPMLSRGVLAPPYKEQNFLVLNEFKKIADELGVSMSELALAWTQSKYEKIISLIGTTNPKHLKSSVNAIGLKLKEEDVARIENTISVDKINGMMHRKWIFTNGVGRLD